MSLSDYSFLVQDDVFAIVPGPRVENKSLMKFIGIYPTLTNSTHTQENQTKPSPGTFLAINQSVNLLPSSNHQLYKKIIGDPDWMDCDDLSQPYIATLLILIGRNFYKQACRNPEMLY